MSLYIGFKQKKYIYIYNQLSLERKVNKTFETQRRLGMITESPEFL